MRFNKTTRIAAAVAVIGAVAAGGAAFTAGNTVPNTVAGFGSATVSGGTVLSLNYTLSSDGTAIDTATIVFSGDTSGDTASIGFNNGNLTQCAAGSVDGAGNTSYTCTLSGVSTGSETSAQISLVNNPASGV
jgi:hypothetical protein